MPGPRWRVALARDGAVLLATDGAPSSWVGARLGDRENVPEDLRQAADRLLDETRHGAVPVSVDVTLESVDATVELSVVDAVTLRRRPTDVAALLRSAMNRLLAQAKAADVTLKLVLDRTMPPVVHLDADKIEWVVTALVGNALRYVRPGSIMMPTGTVVVRASFNSAVGELTVEVRDDGPGMAEEQLAALFHATPTHRRTGLGLVIVREFVAAHGGSLEVHSQTEFPSSATVVRFTLPVEIPET